MGLTGWEWCLSEEAERVADIVRRKLRRFGVYQDKEELIGCLTEIVGNHLATDKAWPENPAAYFYLALYRERLRADNLVTGIRAKRQTEMEDSHSDGFLHGMSAESLDMLEDSLELSTPAEHQEESEPVYQTLLHGDYGGGEQAAVQFLKELLSTLEEPQAVYLDALQLGYALAKNRPPPKKRYPAKVRRYAEGFVHVYRRRKRRR